VTYIDYISVLLKKTIDKTTIDNIREAQIKKREEKQVRKAMDT
jgi:hypothetical protein